MIYDVLPVNSYSGNNSCMQFDFNFYIENENQLEVYLINEDNMRNKLTLNVDYSINEVKNPNGSFITFPLSSSQYDVLNDNQKISIELSLQCVQEIQYNNSSLLNLESLEYSFDYLTRLVQILQRRIDLCVKVEEGTGETPQQYLDKIYEASVQCSNALSSINGYLPQIISYYNDITSNYNIRQLTSRVNSLEDDNEDLSDDIASINTNLNNYLKKDFSNSTIPYIVDSYKNTSSEIYYRKWSDGFIEQYFTIRPVDMVPSSSPDLLSDTCELPVPFTNYKFNLLAKVSNLTGTEDYLCTVTSQNDSVYWSTKKTSSDDEAVKQITFYASGF